MSFLCRLTPFHSEDAPDLTRLFTDPFVREFLGGPLTQEAAAERARSMIAEGSPTTRAIRPEAPAPQDLLGVIWLAPHHGGPEMEISYCLLPEHMGQGYATEAVTAAIQHAFHVLGLMRVISETQTANARSVRLLERVGMTYERSDAWSASGRRRASMLRPRTALTCTCDRSMTNGRAEPVMFAS